MEELAKNNSKEGGEEKRGFQFAAGTSVAKPCAVSYGWLVEP